MGFVFGLLTAPLLGPARGVHWLAGKLAEAAEASLLDEGQVRGTLSVLQVRLDMGELTDEEYARQEKALLERLKAIREAKAERGQR